MKYNYTQTEICRNCENRCSCCDSCFGLNCWHCECNYDEFQPKDYIKYCPMKGESIEKMYRIH